MNDIIIFQVHVQYSASASENVRRGNILLIPVSDLQGISEGLNLNDQKLASKSLQSRIFSLSIFFLAFKLFVSPRWSRGWVRESGFKKNRISRGRPFLLSGEEQTRTCAYVAFSSCANSSSTGGSVEPKKANERQQRRRRRRRDAARWGR